MKVIFLDIDGVLVNRKSFSAEARALRTPGDNLTPFDSECVAQLNRVTEATGAELVMSSTWRIGIRLIEMREFLLSRGVTEPLLDFTPRLIKKQGDIHVAQPRGKEIQTWLDQTHRQISSFIILDDDADMEHLADRLVQTQFESGLTEKDADRAIERLNCGVLEAHRA